MLEHLEFEVAWTSSGHHRDESREDLKLVMIEFRMMTRSVEYIFRVNFEVLEQLGPPLGVFPLVVQSWCGLDVVYQLPNGVFTRVLGVSVKIQRLDKVLNLILIRTFQIDIQIGYHRCQLQLELESYKRQCRKFCRLSAHLDLEPISLELLKLQERYVLRWKA